MVLTLDFRYLKSVFPTVEEYLLLDVLSNSDNNVQKATDRLVKMGYVKRDIPSKFFHNFLTIDSISFGKIKVEK